MTEIMTKNRETKSLLAKLMASENINVEYSEKATTAAFDTEGRTLIMPFLKDISEKATDLFLGHEVGCVIYSAGRDCRVYEKGWPLQGDCQYCRGRPYRENDSVEVPGPKAFVL